MTNRVVNKLSTTCALPVIARAQPEAIPINEVRGRGRNDGGAERNGEMATLPLRFFFPHSGRFSFNK